MKKKIIMTLTTIMLTLSMGVSAFAGALAVNANGLVRVFKDSVNLDGSTYVDIDSMCNEFYLTYDYNEFNKTVNIYDGINTLTLKVDSDTGYLNGEAISVDTPPITDENGNLFLPLRFMAELFGCEVSYDENTRLITLTSDSKYVSNIGKYDNIPRDAVMYSYDDALATANTNNISRKQLALQYDEAERQLHLVQNQIDMTPNYSIDLSGLGMGDYTYNVGSSYVKEMLLAQDAIRNSLLLESDTTQALESGIELSLIAQINALTTAKVNYLLAEDSLALQKTNLDNLTLKNSLGLVSDSELKTAQNTYEQTKTTLNTLQTSIESAEQGLNSILGVDLNQNTYIDYDTTITGNNYDEDKLVKDALNNSINIKNARTEVKNAEGSMQIISNEDSYADKQLALNNANLAYAQSKKDAEKNARDAFNNYQMVIDNDAILHSAKDEAINTYNKVSASYMAGYVTLYEVEAAKLGIAKAEADILQNQLNYKLLTFQLDHPELF